MMNRSKISWLALLLVLAGSGHGGPAVAEQLTFPVDLAAEPWGWPASEYPVHLPARGSYAATVTLDFDLVSEPPPAHPTRLSYVLHGDPAPPPCPPWHRQCLYDELCYPCPGNDRSLELGRHRFQNELSSQMIQQNGRFWKVYLWTERFGGEPGARLTGTLTVTVRTRLVLPEPAITVTQPPHQWLVPADRRLNVAWTRVGKMGSSVHIDLIDARGRRASRLAKATPNDRQEAVAISRAVAAGAYRVRVETVDGQVRGDSGVIHVPPA